MAARKGETMTLSGVTLLIVVLAIIEGWTILFAVCERSTFLWIVFTILAGAISVALYTTRRRPRPAVEEDT